MYSGMMDGFPVLFEFWTNSDSFKGIFREPLRLWSWLVLGVSRNRSIMLVDENSLGHPTSPYDKFFRLHVQDQKVFYYSKKIPALAFSKISLVKKGKELALPIHSSRGSVTI